VLLVEKEVQRKETDLVTTFPQELGYHLYQQINLKVVREGMTVKMLVEMLVKMDASTAIRMTVKMAVRIDDRYGKQYGFQ
jgi:hypothetical protein